MVQYCHTCDNQSHPGPSPLYQVPLLSCPIQVIVITCTSPLCNPYITLHHHMSSQSDLEHHRHHLNEYIHMWAILLSMLAQAHACHTCLLKFLLSPFSIVTLLYLVPFLICPSLFLSWHYHFPASALYLSLYLLHLIVWSPDLHFSQLPFSSSVTYP